MIIYSQLSNLYVKFRKNFIAIFTKTGYIYVEKPSGVGYCANKIKNKPLFIR